ncbi:fasciclin domain-containing protein [Algirhabdus cladophorae]|uniref:fasciclin domain-containing protein n=1 Tax=Algirhabdus cladophorae TaxID=3377108 RepID=UPI003B84893E
MPTFAQIASNDPNFSILVATLGFIDDNLEGSALIATLSDPHQDLTVFAPTNAAFGQLATDLGYTGHPADTASVTSFLTGNVDVTTLNAVILYHVSGGAQSAADIAAAGSVTTLGGVIGAGSLPTLTDLEPDLIDPSLIATDIPADNGILHVIDRVLLPVDLPGNDAPSITEIVASSGDGFDHNPADFDILLKAVVTAGLAETLDSDAVDLTVFAPTDAAFVGLAQELGFHGSNEEGAWGYLVEALTLLGGGDPVPLLTQVLTYHVAGESLQASQVLATDSIATLQGGSLGVDGTSLVDADPDLANPNLIATDIQASNGVVHVIDGVLAPADLLASDGSHDVDFLIKGRGNDLVFTGADADYIDGNKGHDVIFAGSGNDTVLGGKGADFLLGGSGHDLINGDQGRDHISGGHGDDILDGGRGRDVIYGGAGDDSFVFKQGNKRDIVKDFGRGDDIIDLTDFGMAGMTDITFRKKGDDLMLNFGDGDRLVLEDVSIKEITEDQFLF